MNIKSVPSPNFSSGRKGYHPEAIVVHIMEGTLAGTDSWFKNSHANVSAHFGISTTGEVHQYVQETDTAWHAGRVNAPAWNLIKPSGNGAYVNPNYYTIGIEHEGNEQSAWTDAMYSASSELIAELCTRWNIPVDRSHIIGHHEIYSLKTCPGFKVDLAKLVDLSRQKAGSPSDVVNAQGTVTTTTLLNLRRNAPSTSSPLARTVSAGTLLSYVGYTEDGEAVKNNKRWYKTAEGFWFWGGGTVAKLPDISIQPQQYPQWMLDLRMPEIWTKATGRGVGVAVLDTGIDIGNPELPHHPNKFFVYDKTKSLQDTVGHGTHCAGIIGARNSGKNKVGVAPECNLFICKISDSGSLKQEEAIRYADAIDWCVAQPEIKIISASWTTALDDQTILKRLQQSVDNAIAKGKIIVCARGNEDHAGDTGEYYPACLANTIRVGLIPDGQNFFNCVGKISIVTQGIGIESYQPQQGTLFSKSGTSMANAIVAGTIALIVQKMGNDCSVEDVVNTLHLVSRNRTFINESYTTLDGGCLHDYFI